MTQRTFGGLPKEFSSYRASHIAILPVPFDLTTTWMKGSHQGPKAIIEASTQVELYDIQTDTEVYKQGICTLPPLCAKTSPTMIKRVYRTVSTLLADQKFVVTLGGEHTVTLGSIFAHASAYPELSVLQLDAHADLRHTYEKSIYNHACVMARVREKINNVVAVGIRSMDSIEKKLLQKENTFFAHTIATSQTWIPKILQRLHNNDVYVTIDLDVFDNGLMPATGTPEPGGLGWYHVMTLLKKLAASKNIVGFDVVELCPIPSIKAPNFLAAKLIYQLLSFIYFYKKAKTLQKGNVKR